MTRTARASFPRAVQKDRHNNRSGLDPNMRKGGAGGHNWGNVVDEREIESVALEDENVPTEELGGQQDVVEDAELRARSPMNVASSSASNPGLSRTSSGSGEDVEHARKMRKNMMNKKDIDLSAIARTSVAASTSPPGPDNLLRGKGLPISTTTGI